MLRIIDMIEPKYVIAENVLKEPILNAAKQMPTNYNCAIHRISAACLGAPHKRPRWWMVADSNGSIKSSGTKYEKMASLQSITKTDKWESLDREALGMDDGLSSKLDRLKCLGNSIVPQIAEALFRQIKELNVAEA